MVLDDYRDANGINLITMVTNSNPATVMTKEKHYFSNGEQVHFRNVLGMVELNGNSTLLQMLRITLSSCLEQILLITTLLVSMC